MCRRRAAIAPIEVLGTVDLEHVGPSSRGHELSPRRAVRLDGRHRVTSPLPSVSAELGTLRWGVRVPSLSWRSEPRRPDEWSRRGLQPRSFPSFELDESKLDPPRFREGTVVRASLLERLVADRQRSVFAVVAPAGYGKTTFLAQWAQRGHRPLAWVSLDDRANDPTVLLTHLAVALDRVDRVDPSVFQWLKGPGGDTTAVALLTSSIESMHEPVAIVLDHADVLTNRGSRDLVAELAVRLPTASQLAIGSRREVPVPVSILRARGGLAEIGVNDLAMTGSEAGSLLAGAGVVPESSSVSGCPSSWPTISRWRLAPRMCTRRCSASPRSPRPWPPEAWRRSGWTRRLRRPEHPAIGQRASQPAIGGSSIPLR